MRVLTAIILAGLIVTLSINGLPVHSLEKPLVGVKEGDWIEYIISISGSGSAPPTHDVRWMRIEVLSVENTAFSVNLTSKFANGTIGNAVWKFNFSDGNVGGWIIIPANLSAGEIFFDSSIHNHQPVNVTIQSQEQKTVLGASRFVTYGNDSFRHKEWDKLTGVFVGSSESYRNVTTKDGWYIENLTVSVEAIATNLWNSETILGVDQIIFCSAVATIAVLTFSMLLSTFIIAKRRARLPT
jgi:hypothetical protein